MNYHPILYSPAMVEAQRAGRKRQTRRTTGLEVINSQLDWSVRWLVIKLIHSQLTVEPNYAACFTTPQGHSEVVTCPYGHIGDALYVRETIQIVRKPGFYTAWRFADGDVRVWEDERPDYDEGACVRLDWSTVKKTPSIYMPKRFARLWLRINDIRIQRLHEIDSCDAREEGIERDYPFYRNYLNPEIGYLDTFRFVDPRLGLNNVYAEVASYASLFEKINGKGSWKANPWVWAITTKPAERPKLDWFNASKPTVLINQIT